MPQQNNDCDCGVFLLHFVEQFVTNPPAVTEAFIDSKGAALVDPLSSVAMSASASASSSSPPSIPTVDVTNDDEVAEMADVTVIEDAPALDPNTPKIRKGAKSKASKRKAKPEWFPPSDIAEKRVIMRDLLLQLANEQKRAEEVEG